MNLEASSPASRIVSPRGQRIWNANIALRAGAVRSRGRYLCRDSETNKEKHMRRDSVKFGFVILSCLVLVTSAGTRTLFAQDEEDFVLKRWFSWSDAAQRLQQHFNSIAFDFLEVRKNKISTLRTAADWKSRQAEIKRLLTVTVGPFPERTPLKARVLGVIKKDGYRVEKTIFESQPDFYVTGCVFIPDSVRGKAPAILNVIGHTDISFRGRGYQQLLLNLVRKGFIVFAMDPVGQGERLQYYDPGTKVSRVGQTVLEHSYFGKQCFLVGSSAARYFVWDMIRAIDYLVSRPEVDPHRIGVTGLSGGGTQTAYISAFDDRVSAAAPTCYICGFRRLLESIGPQDAEQNFNGGLAHGIDHADLLEVRAPKPTLVVATTRDFFSIQGTRETIVEAKQAFRALGAEQNLALAEDDYVHGYTQKNREAIYAFFQKYLNLPGNPADEKVENLSKEELTITPTGQILDSFGGETVFSLNRAAAKPLLAKLELSRKHLATHLDRVRTEARRLSGYAPPAAMSGLVFRGRHQQSGYTIEKYVMAGEGRCIVPFLLLMPEGVDHPTALIYLQPEGKAGAGLPGGEREWFVKQGYAVLSPDLSGTGELGSVDNPVTFLAVQIGRSVVGIRAEDIARCVLYLKSRNDINTERIFAVARGGMTIPLIHAAAFDPSITHIALIKPLTSMRAVVMSRFYDVPFGDLVPNALTAYDLPDLESCLAPRKLLILNPQDSIDKLADAPLVDEEFQVLRRAYSGAKDNLLIRNWEPSESVGSVFSSWLGR